jgi:hypothetical protein
MSGYYLGDLKSDEKNGEPFEAHARALKYPSSADFFDDGYRKKTSQKFLNDTTMPIAGFLPRWVY